MWAVEFHDEFDPEFDALAEAVQDELLAQLKLLERIGPALGRLVWTRFTARRTPT
jgi:hypothetical protein